MKKQSLTIEYSSFQSIKNLDNENQKLIEKCKEAIKKAYSPYSKFSVGAALLLDDGTIIEGNNQENVAYPSGLCAERVALFYASAKYPNKIVKKIAISAKKNHSSQKTPIVSPCGACRQVMVETEIKQKEPITIILFGEEGNGIIFESINSLMPFAFDISKIIQND